MDKKPMQSGESTISSEINIYYDLAVPGADESEGPNPLLIALHGYGGNKRQMGRMARASAPQSFAIASLQGFHQHIKEAKELGGPLRYGFGWLTNFKPEESARLHHHALETMIDSLVQEGVADARQIFLLGFSQSCALNYRFAFSHPERLKGIVGICGGLPGDWDTNAAYNKTAGAVLHLCGDRDEFYPPERVADYERRLSDRSPDVRLKNYDSGHEITEIMRHDVRMWLTSKTVS